MTELFNVSKRFGNVIAVEDVSLKIEDGQRLVIVGPSGAGKTTLLRLIAGLDRPDSGTVVVSGRPVEEIPPHERAVAVMFQSPALWPHMTLMKNALFGAPRHSEHRTINLFKELGILSIVERYPHEISGGQAQRASLVRALAARKRTVLLDEPFTHVEEGIQDKMINLIDRCVREDSAALVVASHNGTFAKSLDAAIFNISAPNEDRTG